MDLFSLVLWPFKWVIEAILVGFHAFWSGIGFNPDDGLTWVLSILGLVLVVRAALIPLFVKQIKSQRKMLELAPHLKKIQEKYKGKKDQFSREAMSRETMELYKKTGTSPFASCLPLVAQMPIFFSLFQVLESAQKNRGRPGVGLLSADLADSFGTARLFGAPLHGTIVANEGVALVTIIGVVMVVLMTATQFFTQLQIMSKNVSKETMESPMYRQQKLLLYVLPLVFIFSGIAFPLGVMFYWVFSNLWTMGQQFIVIRNSPTPGSEAAKAREARLAKKAESRRKPLEDADGGGTATPVVQPKVNTQRNQPVGRTRSKRTGERRA